MDLQRDMMAQVTKERTRFGRYVDYLVAFRWIAAAGALTAAIAPAIMATADGSTLRGSVSAYWDVDPRYSFWLPFTIAAVLLIIDAALSYVSSNRRDYGGRWFNFVLGIAMLVLTWFDVDNDTEIHFAGASVFFVLFILVIAYTTILAWFGVHTAEGDDEHNRAVEQVSARVSSVFLALLILTLIAWAVGLITFYFFEIFALLNFALYYVQGFFNPFPYTHYEFRAAGVNRIFRFLRIMR